MSTLASGVSTLPLDHKSSLRKMPFPACTSEALRRLHASCVALGQKQPSSPKEMEAMIDAIDEFVFNCGSQSASSAATGSPVKKKQQQSASGTTPLQDLQVLHTILEFFNASYSPETSSADLSVLGSVFLFLFMEPHQQHPSSKKGGSSSSSHKDRKEVLGRLVALAMATKNLPVLHSAGVWMHQVGPASEKSLHLAGAVVDEYIALIPDCVDTLREIPDLSSVFAANLMTAASELYAVGGGIKSRPPPPVLLELFHSWLFHRSLLPLFTVTTEVWKKLPPPAAGGGSSSGASLTPLLGLARWTVIGDEDIHCRLHLCLLQCLCEARKTRATLRPDIVPVKKVTLLIQKVEAALDDIDGTEEASRRQECLDRLGQFLHAVTAAKLLSGGKTAEIISCLKRLPANRLIQAFVVNLAKG